MFGWIKKKVTQASVSQMESDLNGFLRMLRGVPDDSMGSLLLGAAYVRQTLESNGTMPPYLLRSPAVMYINDCHNVTMDIGKEISKHQRNNNQSMGGPHMVWGHSLRALAHLELVPLGKEMWQELVRGFLFLEDKIETVDFTYGISTDETLIEEATFIPPALEPKSIPNIPKKKATKNKEKKIDIAEILESSFKAAFEGSEYQEGKRIGLPLGFYTDPYIFGFIVGSETVHMDAIGGKNWSTTEKGEYALKVHTYLDKNERDGLKRLFLNKENMLAMAKNDDFINGRLHGNMFSASLHKTIKADLMDPVYLSAKNKSENDGIPLHEAIAEATVSVYAKNKWDLI